MSNRRFVLFLLLLLPAAISAQRLVTFTTSDRVEVYADLYLNDPARPYIILAHTSGASRGEYHGIAQKLMNLNYNCLAIDLRNGDKINYTENLTLKNQPNVHSDNPDKLQLDLEAAVDYIYSKNEAPVLLAGSQVSASLALLYAKNNPRIRAVLAFSPGEYFRPGFLVSEALVAYDKPICALGTSNEKAFMEAMLEPVARGLKTTIYHQADRGYRGASLLWENNASSEKFWFDILLFFNELNNN